MWYVLFMNGIPELKMGEKDYKLRYKFKLGFSLVILMLLSIIIAACGDSPTATSVATTNVTTAAATTTVAKTPAASATTTAASTTTAVAKTTSATTAVATTAAATRPAPDPAGKAEPELLEIITTYSKTSGTADEKLKAATDFASSIDVIDESHELYFELTLTKGANEQPVTDLLKAMGGTVEDVADAGGVKIALVTVQVKQFVTYTQPTTGDNFIRALGSLKEVSLINLPVDESTQELRSLPSNLDALTMLATTSKNEGVKAMGVDTWHAAGFNGTGVKIGIIDSGYQFADQLKTQGFLPNDFQVMDFAQKLLSENSLDNGVHGSAVSEIIYSVAPGAKLFPTSIKGTGAEFSEAIDYLVSQQVDIISISMGNNSSSEDGNSPLSKKVEQVRKDKGILFFLASGNEGTEHYGGKFNPDSNGYHQWQPGITRMALGNPTANPLASNVIMRWDQFLDGGPNPTATDLDLIIEDAQGKVLASSESDQRERQPLEHLSLNLPANTLLYIRAKLKAGTPAPTKPFNLHVFLTGGLSPQILTPTQTVGSQADSRGAIAVGAIDPPEGNEIGSYSSQGPLSDGRNKPDISGPAGVSSAAYQAKGQAEARFPGTSAATPNVSSMTAVLKSANLTLTPDELTQVLFESAIKPTGSSSSGPDPVYGYGKASLSNLTPGSVKPKGTLQQPTPNLDPQFQYKNPNYLPAPTADTPGSAPATTAAVGGTPTINTIEVDPAVQATLVLKAGTVTSSLVQVSTYDAETLFPSLEKALLAQGYKFALPGNTKPLKQSVFTIALYTLAGSPDILLQAIDLPEDPSTLLTMSNYPGMSPEAYQKYMGQLKGQKTILVVFYGSDLAKNFGG